MGRINLSEALKPREQEEPATPTPTSVPEAVKATEPKSKPAPAEAPSASQSTEEPKRVAKARTARYQATTKAPQSVEQPTAGARYLTLERKEARLRSDQFAELTFQARRLNRAKGTGGERITENTLIRVAIDLLLANIDKASGSTEDELRNSVTL